MTSVPDPVRWVSPSTGMRFARIEPGAFWMGTREELGSFPEVPRHRVRISQAFHLGIHPVTEGQYRTLNPGLIENSVDHPVVEVSWYEAVAFCNAMSRAEDLEPYYQIGPRRGEEQLVEVLEPHQPSYRLPTEAEWEYACRAGSETAWFWGEAWEEAETFGWMAPARALDPFHPVGRKRPNAWGLHDMHGLVWEWCWDRYRLYPSWLAQIEETVDPIGPMSGSERVYRGGSSSCHPRRCRSAFRMWNNPDRPLSDVGFRVARTVGSSES